MTNTNDPFSAFPHRKAPASRSDGTVRPDESAGARSQQGQGSRPGPEGTRPTKREGTIASGDQGTRSTHVDNVDNVDTTATRAPGGADSFFNLGTRPASRGASRTRQDDHKPVRLREPTIDNNAPQGPSQETVDALTRAARRRLGAKSGTLPGQEVVAPARTKTQGATVSKGSIEQYLARGRLLLNAYKRTVGIPLEYDDVDPRDFVNYMLSRKPELKPATWRFYKQAVYHTVEAMPHPDMEDALRLLDNDIPEEGATASETRRSAAPRRTSALKEKKFPKQDFDKVLAYLRHFSRSKMAPILIDWLIAGIRTGLRPIEWRATDVEERQTSQGIRIWLHVLNAKATNGRAHGITRTLEITHLEHDVVAAIRRMSANGLQWLEEEPGRYESIQSQASQHLYSICAKLFPARVKAYSLYSCRHQFIANAKSLMKPEEISALVGHAVTDTAAAHYGRRQSAWAPEHIGQMPKPLQEDVASVKQRLRFFEERMRQKAEAGLIKMPAFGDDEEE